MKKRKIIIIVGPTAVGKSSYAVTLAKKIGGEIISADSRQVYKELNLLSGKITRREMSGIPHHLLSVASVRQTYTASKFQEKAKKIITEIVNRNKAPIIVGGTGFYIDTLLYGNLPEVPLNKKLRERLNKKPITELAKMLKKLDPHRAKRIDKKNPVRVIRAIEIAKALGKVPKRNRVSRYDPLWIGLDSPDIELKKKIHNRLILRFKKGMINEVRDLRKKKISWKRINELGLEPRYIGEYLQKKLSKKELLEKLEKEIWHYVRRQRTWFKRNKNIKWIVIKS